MSLDLPGFADPVADAQASFRAVLDAMAHPGRVRQVGEELQPPAPLAAATAALLLTLVDADTPLFLAPACEAARDWVVFHTGAPITDDPAGAAFAVLTETPQLQPFSVGSNEAPEGSATLIVQVAGFAGGQRWHLSGPGLQHAATLDVAGLHPDFPALWAANHALYPRGVDLLLVCGASVVALPRSIRLERG
jgi:alpha-D-ribose 1-methylphosphonate 5-triphosphate synthase subunit PhnH